MYCVRKSLVKETLFYTILDHLPFTSRWVLIKYLLHYRKYRDILISHSFNKPLLNTCYTLTICRTMGIRR